MQMTCNQRELAHVLGLSDRRIRQCIADGLFVKSGARYDVAQCVQRYLNFKIDSEVEKRTPEDYEKTKAYHEALKAEITSLKLRRIKGQSHDAVDVEMVIADMLTRFRSKMLSIPQKIAPQLMGQTDTNRIVEVLDFEVRECLEELSEYDPAAFAVDDFEAEDDDEEENAESNSKNM